MPIVKHPNDETALSRLKPPVWVCLQDIDGIVHRALERVMYFGTQTDYKLTCASVLPGDSIEQVVGPATCMICLSGEPDEDAIEKLHGLAVPRTTKTRSGAYPRRRARVR